MRAKIWAALKKTYALVPIVLVLISTSFFDHRAKCQPLEAVSRAATRPPNARSRRRMLAFGAAVTKYLTGHKTRDCAAS